MEYIVIITISIAVLLLLKFIFKINIKNLKENVKDGNLDIVISKFPKNVSICKDILEILDNSTTKIKIAEGTSTIYTVFNDTIIISDKENNYTRLQTLAHEVLHSKQDKSQLWFNFIFSNIYYIYFFIIIILTILNVIRQPFIHIYILTLFGSIYYFVRSYLETDAMLKAKDLANEYMLQKQVCTEEERKTLINKYEQINNEGIKAVNYSLFSNCVIKIIIYSLLCLIKL